MSCLTRSSTSTSNNTDSASNTGNGNAVIWRTIGRLLDAHYDELAPALYPGAYALSLKDYQLDLVMPSRARQPRRARPAVVLPVVPQKRRKNGKKISSEVIDLELDDGLSDDDDMDEVMDMMVGNGNAVAQPGSGSGALGNRNGNAADPMVTVDALAKVFAELRLSAGVESESEKKKDDEDVLSPKSELYGDQDKVDVDVLRGQALLLACLGPLHGGYNGGDVSKEYARHWSTTTLDSLVDATSKKLKKEDYKRFVRRIEDRKQALWPQEVEE